MSPLQHVVLIEKADTMAGMKKSTPKKTSKRTNLFARKADTKQKAAITKSTKKKPVLSVPEVSNAGIQAAIALGVGVLLLGTILWWQFIFLDEQKVFERMLRQTLRTQSVTKVIAQEDATQSFEQIRRLQLGGNPGVIGQTTIEQKQPTEARVVTEEIGTPTQDFVKYVTIDTPDDEGEQPDYSDVIGVWGATQAPDGEPAQGQSFNESIFGILPFGNVSKHDQERLFSLLIEQNVYDVDYLGVTKQSVDGRRVYSYRVALQPQAYVTYVQELAAAQGLTQFQDVNPADFAGVTPIQFEMDIDVYSGNPLFVETIQDQRRESFEDFGRIQELQIPEETIPSQELQQRLQEAQ